MGRHVEYLNGGLVDGPDPATLQAGQLADLQNAVYKPNAPALQRAEGRATWGTATAASSDVAGLRDAHFDNGDHYLIAMISGATAAYVTASVSGIASSGVFGVLTTAVTAAASGLECVQYQNRFYLFNGTTALDTATSAVTGYPNTNQVFYLSATAAGTPPSVRQHGMLPVTATPNYTTASGTFALTVTGYYEYWTTEVAKFTANGAATELESTFAGSPATVWITTATMVPILEIPPARNLITTHCRIYRSPKKDAASDTMFPAGFMVGEQSLTTANASATFADTQVVSNTGPKFAGSFGVSPVYGDFSNASGMAVVGGSSALATVPAAMGPQQSLYNFNFGGFVGSIVGIQVNVTAAVTAGGAPVQLGVTLGNRGSDGRFTTVENFGVQRPWAVAKSGLITATAAGTPQVLVLGGATDRWWAQSFPGFTDSDFGTTFMVLLGAVHPGIPGNKALAVDAVSVTVYYAGSTPSQVVFPTVVYTFGDVSTQEGKNGPPPSSSTGDFFEDALVVNDISNRSMIRYSYAGSPEYFPGTYFLDFETRDNDVVRAIKVVNNRLIVGLERSVWRVNYLPSERDASFDRGKALDPITLQYGCVNAMCMCTFSMDESTQLLAFVSWKGIHITDGYSFRTLTNNLDWSAIMPRTASANPIALINDPENQDLVFYYRTDGMGSNACRALHLSYAAQHLLDGQRLKISGKTFMDNWTSAGQRAGLRSAWPIPRDNGDTTIFLGYGSATAAGGGRVYQETGSDIPNSAPEMSFTTRRMFLAGESKEFRLNEVYAYATLTANSPGATMTTYTVKTNDDAGMVTGSTHSVRFNGRKLAKWQFRNIAEGLTLKVTVTGEPQSAMSWEYLILDGEGFGLEDSGKGA